MTTAAVPLTAPPCADCAGGGEINGLRCRGCGGKGRQAVPLRASARLRKVLLRLAGAAAVPAGTAIRGVPGVGGAAAVTFGLAVGVHAAWRWMPVYGPATVVGGWFLLMIDRRL